MIKGVDGALRALTEEGNIFYTRLDTGIKEGCQILNPTGRVRYLGWFTGSRSRQQKKFTLDCAKEMFGIRTKKVSKLPRFPEFFADSDYSATLAKNVIPLQVAFNRSFKSKGHVNKAMPITR